ncbi:Uridine nucleosidase 1 [Trapelia coarctata]|nr:Uridine nucleosidase 1 [Trapelia coarctata]
MITSSASIPLWLDCDPGHDDVFAILLAAHHPHLNLLGISTVHGNASLENCTLNASRVLQAIGKADIPLYPGAAKPFCRQAVAAANIHGASGLDGTDLLPTATTPPIMTKPAIIAIRDVLLAYPKGVPWIVATGALTNIGLLFAAFPELVEHIAGLSIMGGAIGGGFTNAPLGHLEGREEGERIGNVTRWAEFNIYCDPEAASSIFSNPVLAAKTTLIPLDLTHQVLATHEVQQLLLHGTALPFTFASSPATPTPYATAPPPSKAEASTLRRMLHDLLTFFAHTYASVFGITAGPPLHDPLAVAILLSNLNPTPANAELLFNDHNNERFAVEVITTGLHSAIKSERGDVGRTVVRKLGEGEEGVCIPRGVDVSAFWGLLEECVRKAEERGGGRKR